jgi:hypothetical protein
MNFFDSTRPPVLKARLSFRGTKGKDFALSWKVDGTNYVHKAYCKRLVFGSQSHENTWFVDV